MKFDRNGWARAASVFEEVAGAIGSPPNIPGTGGGTQTDAAISAALGKLSGLAADAFSGLATGLSGDASAMHRTCADYQKTEQQHVQLGTTLAKEI